MKKRRKSQKMKKIIDNENTENSKKIKKIIDNEQIRKFIENEDNHRQ